MKRATIVLTLATLLAATLAAAPVADTSAPAGAASPLFAKSNLVAWCVVPFDSNKRGPRDRAIMFQKLGFKNFAYDWRKVNIPEFDAECDEIKAHGINLSAWWFPTNPKDPVALTILEVCKRHDMHPQLWVSGGGKPVKTPEEQAERVEKEALRIADIVKLAKPFGCQVELYTHNNWFGQVDNQIAVIEKLKQLGITDVGMVYNFSHGHWDIDDFAAKWKRMKPYVVAVNVTGMTRSEKLIPPSQGEHELAMLKVIVDSGWTGPIGLIAEQGGDAEITLSNNIRGLEWLSKEVTKPGSGGDRPNFSPSKP